MSEAERLRAKEVRDQADWMKEHADVIELPGGKAFALFVREAVLAEREACARVAEGRDDGPDAEARRRGRLLSMSDIAAAIRARK